MADLKILSGGAANGLVTAMAGRFRDETGMGISGDFGAVGGMKKRILSGEAVDLVILTRAILDELATEGKVAPRTVRDVGAVVTGIAVRVGATLPDVSTPDALARALLAADAIYFPDPQLATAGIHFAGVMRSLGLADGIDDRMRPFPNGQTAMAAMAAANDRNPIGCTQITEILNSRGVAYAGDLPPGHGLSTTYTAGVSSGAANPDAAHRLIDLLTMPEAAELRAAKGFS